MAAPADAPSQPPYTLELCGKRAAFEVTPRAKLALDLGDAEARLNEAGYPVLTNAGILLVAQLGPVEVSVFESGRLLLKTQDRELAEAATEETYEVIGVDP